MRLRPRTWLRLAARLTAITLAVTGAIIAFSLLTGEKVTQRSFDKIRVGMSQAEICALLGQPEYQANMFWVS